MTSPDGPDESGSKAIVAGLDRGARSRLGSIVAGALLPRDAFLLILRRPALWPWSVAPILMTLALTVLGIVWFDAWVAERLFEAMKQLGLDAGNALSSIALWSARLVLVVLGALSLSTIASIVSSPFNDFLAEEAEKHVTPALSPVNDRGLRWRVKLLILDLGKNAVIGLLTLAVLLASWIPGINILTFGAATMLLTLQFVSFPQTRRGQTLGEGFAFLARKPFACLGFGVSSAFLFSIPFLSAFVIPLAVVGGTLLFARAAQLR